MWEREIVDESNVNGSDMPTQNSNLGQLSNLQPANHYITISYNEFTNLKPNPNPASSMDKRMVVLKGPPDPATSHLSKQWPGKFAIDESVKYINGANKSPSMLGSIQS